MRTDMLSFDLLPPFLQFFGGGSGHTLRQRNRPDGVGDLVQTIALPDFTGVGAPKIPP